MKLGVHRWGSVRTLFLSHHLTWHYNSLKKVGKNEPPPEPISDMENAKLFTIGDEKMDGWGCEANMKTAMDTIDKK